MMLGYSVSSASMYPAIRYAGRLVTDSPNTLEPESTIFNGTYFQDTPPSNWGNATSMSVDPTDDCTFFYTNEYFKPNSLNPSGYTAWFTRIASFKFSSCH